MRRPVGQKMHFPGQGKGFVSTVTVVTPERVRMGFMRILRSSAGSNDHFPLLVTCRYTWIRTCLARYPAPC